MKARYDMDDYNQNVVITMNLPEMLAIQADILGARHHLRDESKRFANLIEELKKCIDKRHIIEVQYE